MAEFVRIDRRIFLTRLGKGALALAVFACAEDTPATTRPTATASATTTPAATATSAEASSTTATAAIGQFVRVDLGFVSAYVVVRGSEAAIVDTGVAESEAAIEAALATVDLEWSAVGHVILTHHHPDHVGSLSAVMTSAEQATGYIGQGDFDNVSGPRELTPVTQDDEIFGLVVVETPGHTAGHISLLDPVASVLVGGDALNGRAGGVDGPDAQFSADHAQALSTVGKIAELEFETLYFGHGDPVMSGAALLVRELAASL